MFNAFRMYDEDEPMHIDDFYGSLYAKNPNVNDDMSNNTYNNNSNNHGRVSSSLHVDEGAALQSGGRNGNNMAMSAAAQNHEQKSLSISAAQNNAAVTKQGDSGVAGLTGTSSNSKDLSTIIMRCCSYDRYNYSKTLTRYFGFFLFVSLFVGGVWYVASCFKDLLSMSANLSTTTLGSALMLVVRILLGSFLLSALLFFMAHERNSCEC